MKKTNYFMSYFDTKINYLAWHNMKVKAVLCGEMGETVFRERTVNEDSSHFKAKMCTWSGMQHNMKVKAGMFI